MKKVKREEILDYVTYTEKRNTIRNKVLKLKKSRRIHLGENLTFLFENKDTILYQIQEMIKAEQLVKEEAILHELETYNELLGNNGELGCVLLIEISDTKERSKKLQEWLGLQQNVYLTLETGNKVYAQFDKRQVDKKRLSSVQFLKFDTNGKHPIKIGVNHSKYRQEIDLSYDQKNALVNDLKNN